MQKLKRIVSVITLLALPVFCICAATISPEMEKAINRIDKMFGNLQFISTRKNGSAVSNARLELINDYFSHSSTEDAPNDFYYLGFDKKYTQDISVARHVNMFQEMFQDELYANCSFSYDILQSKCQMLVDPEFKKGEAPANFANIVVRKVYKRSNIVMRTFTDTLQLNMQGMLICKWTNDISKQHIGGGSQETQTIEQQRANASFAYSMGQYAKAYNIYESIVAKHPEEGDPYYRMAVMLYKKQYGGNLNKRNRQNLILQYLDKAVAHGGYSTSNCASNMKYWLTR